jgi:hypothetical protein
MHNNHKNFQKNDENIDELSSNESDEKWKIQTNFKNKLIKTAKRIEKYNPNYRNSSCFICNVKLEHPKETLRFKTARELLIYCQFLGECLPTLVTYNKDNFIKNKEDTFRYLKNYTLMTKKWKFYNPKFICKCCILKKINSPNCLNYFINTFVDNCKRKNLKNNFHFVINKEIDDDIDNKIDKNSIDLTIDENSNKDIIINIEKESKEIIETKESFSNKSNISNSQINESNNIHSNENSNNENINNNITKNSINNHNLNLNNHFKQDYLENNQLEIINELLKIFKITVENLSKNFFNLIIYLRYANKLNESRKRRDKIIDIIYLSILFHFKDNIIAGINKLSFIQKTIIKYYKNLSYSFDQSSSKYISMYINLEKEYEENFIYFENKINKFNENIINYYNSLN